MWGLNQHVSGFAFNFFTIGSEKLAHPLPPPLKYVINATYDTTRANAL